MKLPYLLLTAIAAFFTAAAFRSVIKKDNSKTFMHLVAEKKKFSIRCSPLYIPSPNESIPLLTGWGNYSWKITTSSDSAQIYFNQGINMYYAFHIIESRASFDKATQFDPTCAMAWWGKALAFGPNINDFGYQRPSEAFPSATKANELKALATPVEKALKDAGLVDESGARAIRSVRVSADNKIDPEAPLSLSALQRGKRLALLEHGLSDYYVGLCLEAHYRNLISTGRLTEALGVGAAELSEVAALYGRTIGYGA